MLGYNASILAYKNKSTFDALKEIIRMRELGLLDICDIPYVPKNKKDEKRIVEVMKKEGLLDDQT